MNRRITAEDDINALARSCNVPAHAQSMPQFDLPHYDGAPTADYVICSTPRCGSTLLGSLLDACGFMGVPAEYFNPRHMAFLKARLGLADNCALDDYIVALRTIRSSAKGIFGIKAHYVQFAPHLPALANALRAPVYVHITRADVLGQAISLTIAQQTDQWSSEGVAKAEPTYDAAAITRNIAAIEQGNAAWEAFFDAHDVTLITVDYDALVASPDEVIAPICTAVGADENHHFSLDQSPKKKQANARNDDWRTQFLAAG